jgi:hypothetical protein
MRRNFFKAGLAKMASGLLIVFALVTTATPSLALWTVTIRNPTNVFCYLIVEYIGGAVQHPVGAGQSFNFKLPGLHCPALIKGYCNTQGTVPQNIQMKNLYDACTNTGWSAPVVCANSSWRVCDNPCRVGTGDARYSVCKE